MVEVDLSTVSEQTKLKYMEFSKKVRELLQKYDEQDKKKGLTRLEAVKRKIKDTKGKWEEGISVKHEDGNIEEIPISLLLAYEYCLATERITQGEVTFEDMLDKLFNNVQKFRIGNPVVGLDDECLYGRSLSDSTAIPVTTKQYRIKMHAGAQSLSYCKDGKLVDAAFIYEKTTIPDFAIDSETGESVAFETDGMDFQELSEERSLLTCFRQTAFHEWTHSAEKELINPDEGTSIEHEYDSVDGKKYINYEKANQYVSTAGITIQEPQYYHEQFQKKNGDIGHRYYYIDSSGEKQDDLEFGLSVHSLDETYCISTGMITLEVKEDGTTEIHNQVDEGFVEAIARAMVLSIAPDTKDMNEGIYYEGVKMAERVFSSRDDSAKKSGKTYADFLMHSSRLKKDLEDKEIDGKVDGLHYIGEYAELARAGMTPKMELYKSIVARLGIDPTIQVKEIFGKFERSDFSEEEQRAFKSFLMSGEKPDKDFVEAIIPQIIASVEAEKRFFDDIPVKLGYIQKEITIDQSSDGVTGKTEESQKSVTGQNLGSQTREETENTEKVDKVATEMEKHARELSQPEIDQTKENQ